MSFAFTVNKQEYISTRAPTRGATAAEYSVIGALLLISTRAPTRGATLAADADGLAIVTHFYSRPYARGDLTDGVNELRPVAISTFFSFLLAPLREGRRRASGGISPDYSISTRAPTRGATYSARVKTRIAEFLLAPLREGRRFPAQSYANTYYKFLLAPLREGRHTIRNLSPRFSPLFLLAPLREGRRDYLVFLENEERISTRAPTRGATPPISAPCSWLRYFYSRPYARGDARSCLPIGVLHIFLLAPLREGRQQFFTKPQVDLYDKLLKNSHFSN